MFRLIRYIILFFIIMLCLFWLNKHNVDIKGGFNKVIDNTKSFLLDIKNATTSDTDHIIDDIKDEYNTVNGTTSVSNTDSIIKSYEEKNDKNKISIDGIIYYTNIERTKIGLKPLSKNIFLNNSASKKMDDMFSRQYFEHTAPDNKTVVDLVKDSGYKFQIVGENLALGHFDNDKDLVQAWMNSPTHKDNILNAKYTEIGIGVGVANYKGKNQWIAVQHFAKPLPKCEEVDDILRKSIDAEKKSLEDEERELQKMAGVIETTAVENLPMNYLNNYNERVKTYNSRLDVLKVDIEKFNETIVKYNSCIKS